MMKKIVIHKPGKNYKHLKIETSPSLLPKPGEVKIAVKYIGVNYADCVVRMGFYSSAKDYIGWPITPGFEFSGTVEALGSEIDDIEIGDQVFGITRFNAYASEVVVPRHQVYSLPSNMDIAYAAGFPVVNLTAYYALIELAGIRSNSKLLIHSAAGGVGSAMVQIAHAEKCEVTGIVGSSQKVTLVQKLGAKHVIDKSKEHLWKLAEAISPSGFDVIADANGVETLKESFKHVSTAGKLIVYGFHTMLPSADQKMNYFRLAWNYFRTPRFNPIQLTNSNKSILCFNLSYLFHQKDILSEGMEYLLRKFSNGKLKPVPIQIYDFENVTEAHQALESKTTQGKLILKV